MTERILSYKLRKKVENSLVNSCDPSERYLVCYHFVDGILVYKECVSGKVESVSSSIKDVLINGHVEYGQVFFYEIFITDILDLPLAYYNGTTLVHRFCKDYGERLLRGLNDF